MIVKTTGIVLRLDPFSKTSEVISWLTPDHGRTATLAKGAKRPRNQLVGQYDCFSTCEFLFYRGRSSALHILKECSPISPREAFRDNWRASFSASYLCDLLNRLTAPGVAHPVLFAWTERALDFLATQGASETVVNWAELQLLKHLGVAPQLSNCLNCGTKSFPVARPVDFSISRGGLLCTACRIGHEDLLLPVTHDVLAMMRGWEGTDTPAMALRTTCTPAQSKTVSRLLSAFIHYHLESSRARDIVIPLI